MFSEAIRTGSVERIMAISNRLAKFPVFWILLVASFLIGRLIPAFYDWSGADQSRPSPIVNQVAIGLLVFAVAICLALPWLPVTEDPSKCAAGGKFQIKLRTMLTVTAVIAAILAIFRTIALNVVGNGLFVLALAAAVRFWVIYHNCRWQMLSLVACMYFPFAWILQFEELSHLSIGFLWMVNGLPGLIPTLLVSRLVQQHPDQLTGLSSAAGRRS